MQATPFKIAILANKDRLTNIKIGYTTAEACESHLRLDILQYFFPIQQRAAAVETARELAFMFNVGLDDLVSDTVVDIEEVKTDPCCLQQSFYSSLELFKQLHERTGLKTLDFADLEKRLNSVPPVDAPLEVCRWLYANPSRSSVMCFPVAPPHIAVEMRALEIAAISCVSEQFRNTLEKWQPEFLKAYLDYVRTQRKGVSEGHRVAAHLMLNRAVGRRPNPLTSGFQSREPLEFRAQMPY